MLWSADFETTNNPMDCRVWQWKSIDFNESHEHKGLDIQSFIDWILTLKSGDTIYFHNLKFDGEFIVYYLLSNGWELIKGKEKTRKKSFRALISDMGQWYTISLTTPSGKTITINDSLKVWTSSLQELARTIGIDIAKGEIDYEMERPVGYEPTELEWEYIDKDVRIPARAMKYMIDRGYTKLTAGANALWDYKNIVGKKFEYYFPQLDDDIDSFIRQSYRGGWTYCNPKFAEKEVGEGKVLDVNSLYPSRMYYEQLPYGNPVYYSGKYKKDELYPLYVQKVEVDFRLKEGYFPTIQKKGCMRFSSTEYIRSTDGEPLELTLTNVDLELMFEHYDILSIDYIEGYKFKSHVGLFKDYIDKWMKIKEEATLSGDSALRAIAKLFMNSLYGKFAKRPRGQSKHPYIGEDNILHFELGEEEDRGSLYIPVGTFITAYARAYTIRSAQACSGRFLYADTDSLHLLGLETPAGIEISKTELGKWKEESTFRRAIFIGAKCYCEEENVSRETLDEFLFYNPGFECHVDYEKSTLLKITVAGLSHKAKRIIKFSDFHTGLLVNEKLVPMHVPGGQILKKTTFEIKKRYTA